ncbi:MAG: glycosyltransferase family 2 protein, partial [Pseudomonadota bacterium]
GSTPRRRSCDGPGPMKIAPRKSPHGEVLAVSMMKDEAPFLMEWYAHHLATGFTKILVYTNDCTDGTDEMLIRLEELGFGYHRPNVIPEGGKPQPSAIRHAQEEPIVGAADWVLLLDADEFLCISHGDGMLDGMLTDAGDANGIVITWRIFGSGGVVDWSREPVTEQYLYAAPPTWNKGWGVKTLFKFDPEYWVLGIHRPRIKRKHLETGFADQVQWLNGSGLPMEDYFKFRGWRSIRRTVGYDWAQINHYAVKSIESYALRKLRGNVNNKKDKYNSDYWALQDRNEVRDEAILRYREPRGAIMAELLTDPVLNRLHVAALERAEARLAEHRETEVYKKLVADLKEASQIPLTRVSAKPPKPRDPERIAGLMSEMEKINAARPAEERRTKPTGVFVDVSEGGDGFVPGEFDIAVETPVDWVANHEIELPADSRIFAQGTLELLMQGKYQRQLARFLRRVVRPGNRVLDLGAGVGFLSMLACRVVPDCQVLAQEEHASRIAVAREVLDRNGLDFGPRLTLLHQPLVGENDAEGIVAGTNRLIRMTRPEVVRISQRAIAETLPRLELAEVPRLLLIGPAAAAYRDQADAETEVDAQGYARFGLYGGLILERPDPEAAEAARPAAG